jgi:hypothetical protein
MNKNTVNVHDNFLSKEDYQFALEYSHSALYHYGETDSPFTKPTGMVHDVYSIIDENVVCFPNELNSKKFFNLFESKIKKQFSSFIEDCSLYRMYINCFSPSENPYFHVDGEGYTFLYYVNDEWDINDGGETQFFVNESFYGIPPVPNRIIVFDASLLHKATSFRNRYRFTIAIKYGNKKISNEKYKKLVMESMPELENKKYEDA